MTEEVKASLGQLAGAVVKIRDEMSKIQKEADKKIAKLKEDKEKIEALYAKIEIDPRHKNVTIFSEDEISKRTFPNWGMAYYPINENNTNQYEYEQFKRNLILLSDLVEPTNITSKQFWKKILDVDLPAITLRASAHTLGHRS